MLDPRVVGDDLTGVLSVYSLSKQSNLAGYRAAFLAGDPALVERLLTPRKHLGLMLPAPVQAAMTAALGDDAHVAEQKERYRSRRSILKPAVEAAGFRIDRSEAGLYLWATEGRDAWDSLSRLADLGILAGPGHFYGEHLPRARPAVAHGERRARGGRGADGSPRSRGIDTTHPWYSSIECRSALAVSAIGSDGQ